MNALECAEWLEAVSTGLSANQCAARLRSQHAEIQRLGAQQDHTAELEHEARLMRARMERLQAERYGIVLAIVERLERACGATGMPPTLIRREFLTEQTQ